MILLIRSNAIVAAAGIQRIMTDPLLISTKNAEKYKDLLGLLPSDVETGNASVEHSQISSPISQACCASSCASFSNVPQPTSAPLRNCRELSHLEYRHSMSRPARLTDSRGQGACVTASGSSPKYRKARGSKWSPELRILLAPQTEELGRR